MCQTKLHVLITKLALLDLSIPNWCHQIHLVIQDSQHVAFIIITIIAAITNHYSMIARLILTLSWKYKNSRQNHPNAANTWLYLLLFWAVLQTISSDFKARSQFHVLMSLQPSMCSAFLSPLPWEFESVDSKVAYR